MIIERQGCLRKQYQRENEHHLVVEITRALSRNTWICGHQTLAFIDYYQLHHDHLYCGGQRLAEGKKMTIISTNVRCGCDCGISHSAHLIQV